MCSAFFLSLYIGLLLALLLSVMREIFEQVKLCAVAMHVPSFRLLELFGTLSSLLSVFTTLSVFLCTLRLELKEGKQPGWGEVERARGAEARQ